MSGRSARETPNAVNPPPSTSTWGTRSSATPRLPLPASRPGDEDGVAPLLHSRPPLGQSQPIAVKLACHRERRGARGPLLHSQDEHALVAQGIEHAPPERGAQVRILPRALPRCVVPPDA